MPAVVVGVLAPISPCRPTPSATSSGCWPARLRRGHPSRHPLLSRRPSPWLCKRHPDHRRRRHRQRAGMVRLRGLRLLRRGDRPRIFPSEDPVAQVLAAFGIFAVGFLMRPVGGALSAISATVRPARRAHLLGRGDGDPDIPGRRAARLPDAGPGGADRAHAAAHGPGPVGRRRIHDLDRVHGRARPARPPRPDRRLGGCGAVGGILGLGDGSAAHGGAARGASSVGLAHAVPAGPARRPGGLLPAPRHRRGSEGQKAGRSPLLETVASMAAAAAAGRRCRSSTRSAST